MQDACLEDFKSAHKVPCAYLHPLENVLQTASSFYPDLRIATLVIGDFLICDTDATVQLGILYCQVDRATMQFVQFFYLAAIGITALHNLQLSF